MISELQKAADTYFLNQERKTPTVFEIDLTIPNTTYEVDLLYLENPKYDNQKGIIYYYCGEIDDPVTKGFLKEPQYNHVKWDSFNSSDGDLQVFLGHHILSEMFSDISDSKSLKFFLNGSNLPANSSFNLDIESLGLIAPSKYHII